MKEKAQIMMEDDIRRALLRISHEILEKNKGVEHLALIGVISRGDILAHRIAHNIEKIEGKSLPVGVIDVTLYRDDVNLFERVERKRMVSKTDIPFEVNGQKVILVDDVLYHGRTIRAAMDELNDFGRPATIQLAVLIDRGHRELPISADYVGKNIPTSRREWVNVQLKEKDGLDCVVICEED